MSKNELYNKMQAKCNISSDDIKTIKSDIDDYVDELLKNNVIQEVAL